MDFFGATWYQPTEWEIRSLMISFLLGPATLVIAMVLSWRSYQGEYPWWPLRIFWNLWLVFFLFCWFCWWAVHGMAILSIRHCLYLLRVIQNHKRMNAKTTQLAKRIRVLTALFMLLLILSGITAFPVQTELNFLKDHINWFPLFMQSWLVKVTDAVNIVSRDYPYLVYGYDWLAYAHIVIALFFFGVLKDPVRNAWVLRTGMLACAGVFVLAFVVAGTRGIPFFWTLIDCSFGFFGFIPLFIAHRWSMQLERMQQQEFTNSPHTI